MSTGWLRMVWRLSSTVSRSTAWLLLEEAAPPGTTLAWCGPNFLCERVGLVGVALALGVVFLGVDTFLGVSPVEGRAFLGGIVTKGREEGM